MWNRNPKRSPTLYVFFFFFKSSLFSYVEAKFNKDEYFKSTVALLVKLLNHSLLPAFHCQQSKADNHSFSQGVKSLRWHWSLEKSTHGTHTEYNKSVRCEWKPPSSFLLHIYNKISDRKAGKGMWERDVFYTHRLSIIHGHSEHQHKHSGNPTLPHDPLGCIGRHLPPTLCSLGSQTADAALARALGAIYPRGSIREAHLKLWSKLYTLSPPPTTHTGLYCRKWTTNKSSSGASSGAIQSPSCSTLNLSGGILRRSQVRYLEKQVALENTFVPVTSVSQKIHSWVSDLFCILTGGTHARCSNRIFN